MILDSDAVERERCLDLMKWDLERGDLYIRPAREKCRADRIPGYLHK